MERAYNYSLHKVNYLIYDQTKQKLNFSNIIQINDNISYFYEVPSGFFLNEDLYLFFTKQKRVLWFPLKVQKKQTQNSTVYLMDVNTTVTSMTYGQFFQCNDGRSHSSTTLSTTISSTRLSKSLSTSNAKLSSTFSVKSNNTFTTSNINTTDAVEHNVNVTNGAIHGKRRLFELFAPKNNHSKIFDLTSNLNISTGLFVFLVIIIIIILTVIVWYCITPRQFVSRNGKILNESSNETSTETLSLSKSTKANYDNYDAFNRLYVPLKADGKSFNQKVNIVCPPPSLHPHPFPHPAPPPPPKTYSTKKANAGFRESFRKTKTDFVSSSTFGEGETTTTTVCKDSTDSLTSLNRENSDSFFSLTKVNIDRASKN